MQPDLIPRMFPGPSFREGQEDALNRIAKAFKDGADVVFLDAPTGAGKSLLNTAVARASDSAFITSPQVALVDQINGDPNLYPYMSLIKGKRNYPCVLPGVKPWETVADAKCQREKKWVCPERERCPYFVAKAQAQESHTALMTLAYFLLVGGQRGFGHRELLVIDEGHGIENWAVSLVSLTLSNRTVSEWEKRWWDKKLEGFDDDPHSVQVWLAESVIPWSEGRIEELEEWQEGTSVRFGLTTDELKELERLQQFVGKYYRFSSALTDGDGWVCEVDVPEKRVVLQPVIVGPYLGPLVWDRADKFLISSATLLDPESFAVDIGIPTDKEWALVQVPSYFPVGNRPTVDMSKGRRMSRGQAELNIRGLGKTFEQILDQEKGNRGIVHCHAYKYVSMLYSAVSTEYRDRLRPIFMPQDRKRVFEAWLTEGENGSVLMAPAYTEGIDLRDDLCRFQILFKTAYPYLGDRRVKARRAMEGGARWYENQALLTLLQSAGRAVRSPTDFATFYILDASALSLVRRAKERLPEWFMETWPSENKEVGQRQ